MADRLKDKVALITGGARGQGAAEAKLFVQEGATVIVADVLESQGRALVEDIRSSGGAATFLTLNITQEPNWKTVLEQIHGEHGALHILINNAGANVRRSLTEMTIAEWHDLIAINLTGAMLGMRACAPLIRASGGGAIVNIGSAAGLTGHPTTAYSTAKWGLRGLTKSAAFELLDWGIRVNCMHPGAVDTPLLGPQAGAPDKLAGLLPMRRAGTPDELARTVLFLASDDAAYITGVDLPVDGGLTDLGVYRPLMSMLVPP